MMDQRKLKHGTKDIEIEGWNATYTGLLDSNGNAFGKGEGVESNGTKYKGYFKDNKPLFCM